MEFDNLQTGNPRQICKSCNESKFLNTVNWYRSPATKTGFQSTCKRCVKIINKIYHQEHKEEVLKRNKKRRQLVLDHYGNTCACCGETVPEFLAVDHINNDGFRHRLELGNHGGYHMYLWLLKNNFPPGFQLLCHNCNCAKAFYGACPHQL